MKTTCLQAVKAGHGASPPRRLIPFIRTVLFAGVLGVAGLCAAAPASAQDANSRLIRIHFTPTTRAQLALWIEHADGTYAATLRLTEATAVHGIGNRPGASQMNSGFRWPYGRREGVLPIWGHRRAMAPGAQMFRRVIFQDRTSEGLASRSTNDFSPDSYYCLSFDASRSARDALDAVSCASVFNSDKGAFLSEERVEAGYGEPYEATAGNGEMRPLSYHSIYPPRRDVMRCTSAGCLDHEDVGLFVDHARSVMPEIDAITMATPLGDAPQTIQFTIPDDWPNGEYVLYLEANVEGDYNDHYNDSTFPTPTQPPTTWDHWAIAYGYPFRGQPSVVYRTPFSLEATGGSFHSETAYGYGDVNGTDGEISSIDETITTDPTFAPGSGGDRLRANPEGHRLAVEVVPTNICGSPMPPPECGSECDASTPCPEGFICTEDEECIGMCDVQMPPDAVSALEIVNHPEESDSHHFALMRFRVPEARIPIARYEIRYGIEPILDEETFMQALPAKEATIDSVELVVPTDGAAGDWVEVELGGMIPQTQFFVAVRAIDICNSPANIETVNVTTTEINFTTVSPCFVATAAYGSPMAQDLGTLRRFRDRHLLTNSVGRAFVSAYYEVGPHAARVIEDHDWLRSTTRFLLQPVVAAARFLD